MRWRERHTHSPLSPNRRYGKLSSHGNGRRNEGYYELSIRPAKENSAAIPAVLITLYVIKYYMISNKKEAVQCARKVVSGRRARFRRRYSGQGRLADGQSVMLSGPRRIGKTSIAYEVIRRLKQKGFYTASVDFFRISDRRELAVSLIDACLENRTGIRLF